MATAKLAFLAVAVLLLQVSWCAVAQQAGTAAVMAVTGFEVQDGGTPAACDEQYHSNLVLSAALSTEWYAGGSRCFKSIRIWNSGRTTSVLVQVVDECGSQNGCKDNVVATSKSVWDALGLDTDVGLVSITWADA